MDSSIKGACLITTWLSKLSIIHERGRAPNLIVTRGPKDSKLIGDSYVPHWFSEPTLDYMPCGVNFSQIVRLIGL